MEEGRMGEKEEAELSWVRNGWNSKVVGNSN